jgi:SAM-dependent methyltransferase
VTDRIERIYSEVAPVYDQVGPRFFSSFGELLVAFAELPRGATVLDVACGRGAALRAAAGVVGAHGRLVGVDVSAPMVEHCRDDLTRARVPNAEVLRMRAESLELPDESFDHVLCSFGLSLFADPLQALREMHRVLRAGGRVTVSVLAPERDRRWWWLWGIARRHLGRDRPDGPAGLPLSSDREVAAALERAGFGECRAAETALDVSYGSESEWLATIGSHWARELLDALDPDELLAFRRRARRHLELAREADGRFHHAMSAIFAAGAKAA